MCKLLQGSKRGEVEYRSVRTNVAFAWDPICSVNQVVPTNLIIASLIYLQKRPCISLHWLWLLTEGVDQGSGLDRAVLRSLPEVPFCCILYSRPDGMHSSGSTGHTSVEAEGVENEKRVVIATQAYPINQG